MRVTKAVIPVAGIGSRFLPATKALAKELFPLVNKPILMYLLEECMNSGITDVFVVISKKKENVREFLRKDEELEKKLDTQGRSEYLSEFNKLLEKIKITIGYQNDPKGSGHALLAAEKWVQNEPFAVLFGDDLNYTAPGIKPVTKQLIDVFEKYNKMVIGCKRVQLTEIHKYSSVIVGKKIGSNCYEAKGIVEKPSKENAPSNISGLARYILPSGACEVIRNTPFSSNGELGLTDTMDIIARNSGGYACIFKSRRYDTGDKLGYAEAFVEYALRDKEIGQCFEKFIKKIAKQKHKSC